MQRLIIQVLLLALCCTSQCAAQVILELCNEPIKDEICVLKCLSPDLSQSVVFKKDNTEYASCKFILGTLSCTSIYPTRSLISQPSSSPGVTNLNITQLSRAWDQGSWTCDYGSTGSSARTLTVLTAPTQRRISSNSPIDYCAGNSSATFNVTLTVSCSSPVTVSAELSSPTTGMTYREVLSVTKGPACADVAENIYTTVFTITSTTGGLTGDEYTLILGAQLSGGVGQVYKTVFPGNITFSCPVSSTISSPTPQSTITPTPPSTPAPTPPTTPAPTPSSAPSSHTVNNMMFHMILFVVIIIMII